MTIEIRQHTPGENVEPFIQAGLEVLKHDPTWVAPLHFEMKERLDGGLRAAQRDSAKTRS